MSADKILCVAKGLVKTDTGQNTEKILGWGTT